MVKALSLKRANSSEDVANAVLFLASSESDTMTGQDIIMDGGVLAVHPGHIAALER